MKGKRRRFPKHRQTVLEIIQAANTVPAFPLETSFVVGHIEAVRRSTATRIGWVAIFAKAYALVCEQHAELREIFVTYPWAHLYQHPTSICSVSVHREDGNGNERLIWGRIESASSKSLIEIQNSLKDCVDRPIDEVYRDGLRLEKAWWFIRKLAWWWVIRCSGRKRAKLIGTFSISSLGGHGCLNGFHPLITTSSLAFGPIDQDGRMRVVLLCDHRTLDGMLGALVLQSLERVLKTSIVDELNSLRGRSAAA